MGICQDDRYGLYPRLPPRTTRPRFLLLHGEVGELPLLDGRGRLQAPERIYGSRYYPRQVLDDSLVSLLRCTEEQAHILFETTDCLPIGARSDAEYCPTLTLRAFLESQSMVPRRAAVPPIVFSEPVIERVQVFAQHQSSDLGATRCTRVTGVEHKDMSTTSSLHLQLRVIASRGGCELSDASSPRAWA